MNDHLEGLLDQALQLSPEDRVAFAERLWASLHDSVAEIDAAWTEEARARLQRIESGVDRPVPWAEVRGRLRREPGE